MRYKFHRWAAIAALFATASCVLPPTEAELATYQAVAPDHRAYVEADTKLDVQQKQRRLDLLESWRIRVGGAK